MADLIVKPAYKFGPKDILDADKLNLLATPVVELALTDPVNDQNFFRNGNFYSSFWTTPAGLSCPVNVWTTNANYWLCRPVGAPVTFLRSSVVPDQFSLFTAEVKGAASVGLVEFGQQINGDLSATLRRKCTFSGYVYNSTGLTLSPTLNIYTCNAFNNFAAITLQTSVNLQTGANATWTYCTATIDLASVAIANVANGLLIAIALPAGALNVAANNVLFSRLKFQIGEVATEFVDDPSLFITTPSVDSTMLQDGCIARPSLFLPNVVPTGAYQAKSINNGDINDGAINGRTIAAGAVAANLGYTPVNKAGDTGIGILDVAVETVVGSNAPTTSGVIIEGTAANQANDGYFPSISFKRGTGKSRAVGLDINGKLKTVDGAGVVGWLLDSVHQVDTASIQDKAVTLTKLSDALVALLIAPGTIHLFAGPSPPGGWFVCDGSAVSRTTYAALFSAIGTYWGAGDNVNTFNLPNFVNRVPVGYGAGASWNFATAGGEVNHTLSWNEMPNHGHGVNDGQHTHASNPHHHSYVNPLGGAFGAASGPFSIYNPSGTTNTSDTADSMQPSGANISIQNAGNSFAHNNMQPYAVLYYIIKS
jgi:microcystin-dependent protein